MALASECDGLGQPVTHELISEKLTTMKTAKGQEVGVAGVIEESSE